jgi:putative two-component system response regulator
MAKMAESRDGETQQHLQRMQGYTRSLAQEAARSAPWAGLVDERFVEMLQRCVPLHDIGKIGLPDAVQQQLTARYATGVSFARSAARHSRRS